jgi:RsmE family RNA methyltransferase
LREQQVNLLLFTAADRLDDQRIRFTGRRLHHLRQVLGAAIGDELRVGELNGLTGLGRILDISSLHATLAVELREAPPAKLPLCLVLALPRPKMLRRIIRSVAELGVAELHLIHSYRVEKSYWQTPVLQEQALHDYLLQGLEQSRDTVLPSVTCHRRFKPFVEDTLPTIASTRQSLLAHPGDFPGCPRDQQRDTLLVIGPEGGFIPYEVEKLERAGCQPVSLGPRILRVETALTALLGRLF